MYCGTYGTYQKIIVSFHTWARERRTNRPTKLNWNTRERETKTWSILQPDLHFPKYSSIWMQFSCKLHIVLMHIALFICKCFFFKCFCSSFLTNHFNSFSIKTWLWQLAFIILEEAAYIQFGLLKVSCFAATLIGVLPLHCRKNAGAQNDLAIKMKRMVPFYYILQMPLICIH